MFKLLFKVLVNPSGILEMALQLSMWVVFVLLPLVFLKEGFAVTQQPESENEEASSDAGASE